jgi:hypothetical protein
VCLLDSPSTCTATDFGGSFSLGSVAAQGSGLAASTNGWVTSLFPLSPPGNATLSLRMWTQTSIGRYAQDLGTTLGPLSGLIAFSAFDGSGKPASGVRVSVPGGAPMGYFKADGVTLDPTLTATSSSGTGLAFVPSPGTIAVTFSAPGRTCTRIASGAEGWAPSGSETLTAPVQSNEVTGAAATCQ